jgi:hypothetical protein
VCLLLDLCVLHLWHVLHRHRSALIGISPEALIEALRHFRLSRVLEPIRHGAMIRSGSSGRRERPEFGGQDPSLSTRFPSDDGWFRARACRQKK